METKYDQKTVDELERDIIAKIHKKAPNTKGLSSQNATTMQ